MFERIFGNWKTTVAGTVLAFGQYLVAQGEHGFTWESFLPSLGTLIFAALVHDKPKTP